MFDTTPFGSPKEERFISEQRIEDTCPCRKHIQSLQECTNLLSSRLMSSISNELAQFQMSLHQLEPIQSQDSDSWDIDATMVEPFNFESMPSAESLILDILTKATQLYLSNS